MDLSLEQKISAIYLFDQGDFYLLACLPCLALPALAHHYVPDNQQSACMQAPANLDPTTLTEASLRAYGLPLRPTDSQAQNKWLKEANRIKLDQHICSPQLITGSDAHHSTFPTTRSVTPSVTQYQTTAFAGNYAIGSQGSYSFSTTNYNLPCMNTSVRNSRASIWLGLGGWVSNTPLVQAGTDVLVNSNGNVTYYGWIESTGAGFDDGQTFAMPNSHCGNTMYIEVDSNFEGSGVDYYIVDGGGINVSMSKSWPLSAGDSGECMVERSHNSSDGSLITLANFNYIAFSNCEINANGIGNLNHNYDVMVNGLGQLMAGVGPISGGGNYRVTWYRAS